MNNENLIAELRKNLTSLQQDHAIDLYEIKLNELDQELIEPFLNFYENYCYEKGYFLDLHSSNVEFLNDLQKE